MKEVIIRCPAVTTKLPGGNAAQCDLEFEHDEDNHSVCFGHGAYTTWADDDKVTLTTDELKKQLTLLDKMSKLEVEKVWQYEHEVEDAHKRLAAQNGMYETIRYYISNINNLIEKEEIEINKNKYNREEIEKAKTILREIGVIK